MNFGLAISYAGVAFGAYPDEPGEERVYPLWGDRNAHTSAVVPSQAGNFGVPTAGGIFLCLYGREYGAYPIRGPDPGNAAETSQWTL